MTTRLRLQIAAAVVAVVVIGLIAALTATGSGGGGGSPVLVATAGSAPFSIATPATDRAAERILTGGRAEGLRLLLTLYALPVVPRDRRLEVPLPPPRYHRLHVAPTRLALTSRAAPIVASDLPFRVSPQRTVPGALPKHFAFSYDDGYRGWPTKPLHGPHAVHGAFDDPRLGGYHFGVDIAVDDAHPALAAPKGLSHRVYAVEGGVMHWARNTQSKPCNARRFDIGHFAYWHLEPTVPLGTRVHAGEMVGWTCLNEWHVHLSEWARVDGKKRWVNPLHPGGKLTPYVDSSPPQIRSVYAYGPPATWWKPKDALDLSNPDGAPTLALDDLHGAVDLRAWIDDPQGFLGVFEKQSGLASTTSPYRVWIQLRQTRTRAIVWQRTVFQNDLLLSGVLPFYALYGSGSRPTLSDYDCLHSRIPCDGRLFYHLVVVGGRYLWDTRSVENGGYTLTIKAYDIAGNVATRVSALRVAN